MKNHPVRIQRNIALLAIVLFAIKIVAWLVTGSVAIFTDALESTVNMVTGLFGWYSLWLASKPRDENHPYGHGKVEFISSAIEGTLISIAGIIIIIEAIRNFDQQKPLQQLDLGLVLIAITALINFLAGTYSIRMGKKNRSATMIAGGQHLRTDTYSTAGIIVGIILIKFTGWLWLDAVVAIIFALIILVTGYRVLRHSISGIMDEADHKLIDELLAFINLHRKDEWIDLHNLRIIKYGSVMHVDGHLTVPWYFSVREGHDQVSELEKIVKGKFGEVVELFIHLDPCEPFSCKICNLHECKVRKAPFQAKVLWNTKNVMKNSKHNYEDATSGAASD